MHVYYVHGTGVLSPVGDLISTIVDNCTLRLTWTAPYTLQGVPINYYTINITRHSDGAVLRTDTTNTTEYLYSVSNLGETLEKIEVAAMNDAGTGNTTSIMTQMLSSSELIFSLLGTHGSASLCRVERENKMAATYMY